MWKITPQNDKFITMLYQSCLQLPKTTQLFCDMVKGEVPVNEAMDAIDLLKAESKQITDQIASLVWQSYVTPMDREDIYNLAKGLYNFVRILHATIERFHLYRLANTNPNIQHMAERLHTTIECLPQIINSLKGMRSNSGEIAAACDLIADQEAEADFYYRNGLAQLFDSGIDAIEIIKWREILQHIEKAFDHCEKIGDHIKKAVIKYV